MSYYREKDEEEQLVSMSLGDHLEELRGRLVLTIVGLVIGIAICLVFGKYLVGVLKIPYQKTAEGLGLDMSMITIHPAEGFMVFLKTSLLFGLLISSPWVIWQIWAFVASGLYKKERKFAYNVAPISAVLFIGGSIFFITVVAPLTMAFFVKFNQYMEVQSQFTLQNYVNMILILVLVFGLAFQMPIIIVFAERMHLVTIELLTSVRKFMIIGLVVVSAMITPPDFVSQVALAGPLYVLYEASIVVCRILRKRAASNDS